MHERQAPARNGRENAYGTPVPAQEILDGAAGHEERAHRRAILEQIGHKLAKNGPHQARASAERARQFKPFAALKGFEEITAAQEAIDRTGLTFEADPERNRP